MNDLSVIDHFLGVFSQYIDSGFGLVGGEVAFLTATLVAIDMTLAGLFWAMSHAGGGGDEVMARLIRKVLYVGTFAFILGNFNQLAGIVFRSFAGLGLTASGSGMTPAQLLQPGRVAQAGVDAARPIMQQIGELTGFPEVFANLDMVAVLFLAWLVVIVSFFVLAVQLFVTLIEFKLTTLAGFVLVPFALWNKTAFLAEKVLGNVVSSGVKVLVLAVIVGIGSGLFAQFQTPAGSEPSIDQALAIMLASLALFGLGIFGPGIATGLVSGAPQLGAGAAAGTILGTSGLAVAGGAAAAGAATAVAAGARLAPGATRSAIAEGTSLGRAAQGAAAGAKAAFREGSDAAGGGAAGFGPGLANVARKGAQAAGQGVASVARAAKDKVSGFVASAAQPVATNAPGHHEPEATDAGAAPSWARRLQRRQQVAQGASTAAHVLRSGDHGGGGSGPPLQDTSNS